MLSFLDGRATCGVEAVVGESYLRTVSIGDTKGWITVVHRHENNMIRVEVSAALSPSVRQTLTKVKYLFDLSAHPVEIENHLGELAIKHSGLRVPGAFYGFELAVRAILGQQVSVRAATTLAGRFNKTFGEPIETPFPELTHLFPKAERIAAVEQGEIVALGIIRTRANTIVSLAKAVAGGSLVLRPESDPERVMSRLRELPGIGEWTA